MVMSGGMYVIGCLEEDNPNQRDSDRDGIGDSCDDYPNFDNKDQKKY